MARRLERSTTPRMRGRGVVGARAPSALVTVFFALSGFLVAGCVGTVDGANQSGAGGAGAGSTSGSAGTSGGGGGAGTTPAPGSDGGVVITSTGGSGSGPSSGGSGNPSGGTGGGPVGGGATGGTGGGTAPATRPASLTATRLLTTSQFRNSLLTLLGPVTVGPVQDDSRVEGFSTVGAAQIITTDGGVEQYQLAVDGALDQLFSDTARRGTFAGCVPSVPAAGATDACTRTFITRFGRLAFRRPLSTAESTRYTTLATAAAQNLVDAYAGIRWAASGILQSPNFLYRAELGETAPDRTDARRLTSLEMASRLSFFLWDAPPDDTLLKEAEASRLITVEAIRTQAHRLLAAPAGRRAVGNFARDLFWLDRLSRMSKDPVLFPRYTPALQQAMANQVIRSWEDLVFDQDASILDILTTRRTFVNAPLATLYGITAPGAGTDPAVLTAVELPANSPRVGMLGSAGLLAMYANQKEGSPSLRGKFIRESLLCQTIPAPPDNVNTTLPEPPAGVVLTHREKLELHHAQGICRACHLLMDPPGFGLEHFDAVGAYRATDNGKPVDSTGSLNGTAFDGLPQLASAIAAQPEFVPCLVKSLLRYATGTAALLGEETAVQQLTQTLVAANYRLKPLLVEIAVSEAFRFVKTSN